MEIFVYGLVMGLCMITFVGAFAYIVMEILDSFQK